MSTSRALLIVVILIVLVIAGALVSARAQVPIECEGGMCTIPEEYLRVIVQEAGRAEQYAFMCGWIKKED